MTVKTIINNQLTLSQKSVPATQADLQDAIDLRDTLVAHQNQAAGLAANMIGVNKSIIAFYVGPLAIVMLNPKIISVKNPYLTEEGCLSLEGMRPTQRYKEIEVEYQDMKMKKHREKFSEFTAEVIQHEVDHCQGKII